MKKSTILATLAVSVLIVGTVYFINNRSSKEMMMENKEGTMMKQNEASMDSTMHEKATAYVTYSSQELSKDTDKKRVLFFYANWCPTCSQANKEFLQNLSKIPQNIKIIKVNYSDSETDSDEKTLATKYGVTYQHTFVQIDSNGNEVTKWNGGGIETALEKIK